MLPPERSTGGEAALELYRRLGIRPIINAYTTLTRLGGCIMAPEVVAAMEAASRFFVDLDELLVQAGRHLAKLTGADAALVTSGASAALTLGAAACMTGTDPEKVRRLPNPEGMKCEVVIQRAHRSEQTAGIASGYLKALELPGSRLIEVETRQELERVIHERTAMLHFANYCEPFSTIPRAEWLAVAKAHGVPAFLDAAEANPPRSRIREFVEMGFDLISFSGSKGFLGPQCSGLLLGREDLIEAARLHMCPNVDSIGRGFKVGKEEIVGLVAAVERSYRIDEEAEMRALQERLDLIREALRGLEGIETEFYIPPERNVYPHLRVSWNQEALGFTWMEIAGRLWAGDPPIAVRTDGPGADRVDGLGIGSFTLRPGDAEIVGRRLRDALEEAMSARAGNG